MKEDQQFKTENKNQSKEQKLYQVILKGDVDGIKKLHREGANLEWTDKEGKTPLIKACMNKKTLKVAGVLIDLGSNVNAFCPGRNGGTPLLFAAVNDVEKAVELLLSSGANAFVRNDEGKTALDVARMNGCVKAVRAIENHISCFSGRLLEYHGSGFFSAPSKEIWVVVIPVDANFSQMELVIYRSLEDAQPHAVINLSESVIEETKLDSSNPRFTLIKLSTKTAYKFASVAGNGGKKQLNLLHDICNGVCVNRRDSLQDFFSQLRTSREDEEIARAIRASLDSAYEKEDTDFSAPTEVVVPFTGDYGRPGWLEGSSSRWMDETKSAAEGYDSNNTFSPSVATAPPLVPDVGICIICCEAPVEGACVPCGHMNCCMACLKKVKAKKNSCPICRAKIDQVVRIHTD